MKHSQRIQPNRKQRSYDVHTPDQRSFNMSKIRGSNTKPELALRKALWRLGVRYRLSSSTVGKPDLILVKWRAVVFVDGCFWHVCPKHIKWPRTNAEFWEKKLAANVARDKAITKALQRDGWLVLRIWEHDVRSDVEKCAAKIYKKLTTWRSDRNRPIRAGEERNATGRRGR